MVSKDQGCNTKFETWILTSCRGKNTVQKRKAKAIEARLISHFAFELAHVGTGIKNP
jgi:hypothetical protein